MASLAQFMFSAKALLVCFGLSPESSSGTLAFLMLLVMFIVFLAPFDRRIIERYIMRIGAKSGKPDSSRRATDCRKLARDNGLSETVMPGGPYTQQLCNLLDLEVVVFRQRNFFHVRSGPVKLAIGRWNQKAHEFEVVTEWCETWEDLEEEARRAVKSFREIASPKYRGASNV